MRRRLLIPVLVVLAALVAWLLLPVEPVGEAPEEATAAAPAAPPAIEGPRRRKARVPRADAPAAASQDPAAAMPLPQIVRCALPPEVVEQAPGGVARVPGRGRVEVRSQGAWLEIPAPTVLTDTVVRVDLDGWATAEARLHYAAGGFECALAPLIPAATLTGRVITREGADDGRVQVVGCGRRITVDRDGGFFLEVDPTGPCEVRAIRRDGPFTLRSPAVEVTPGAGQEIILDMSMPPFRAAGVGTAIATTDEGILVENVIADSLAQRAGLQQGDIVIGLDGQDVSGWTTDEFIDLAIGPEGTEVVYTVLRDGERVEVRMVRSQLADRG